MSFCQIPALCGRIAWTSRADSDHPLRGFIKFGSSISLFPAFGARIGADVRHRTLSVLDDFNREGLCIEVDFSLPAERVVRSLNRIIE